MNNNLNAHLASIGEWGAEFRCTPLIFDIFKRRNIYLTIENHSKPDEILRFESGVAIEPYSQFYTRNLWSMGSFSYSRSPWDRWAKAVSIGRYNSIASGCLPLMDRHPIEWATSSILTYQSSLPKPDHPNWACIHNAYRDFGIDPPDASDMPKPLLFVNIAIENDVWVGDHVFLGQNVKIGTGAVIAAGSIVTRDVEPYMIVGGVPARIIRPRFEEKLIEKLLESRWWEFGPDLWKFCNYKNPEKFVDQVVEVRETKKVSVFRPEKTTFRHIANDLMERA